MMVNFMSEYAIEGPVIKVPPITIDDIPNFIPDPMLVTGTLVFFFGIMYAEFVGLTIHLIPISVRINGTYYHGIIDIYEPSGLILTRLWTRPDVFFMDVIKDNIRYKAVFYNVPVPSSDVDSILTRPMYFPNHLFFPSPYPLAWFFYITILRCNIITGREGFITPVQRDMVEGVINVSGHVWDYIPVERVNH